MALEPHGPDTFVGTSLPYEWGRIYGGQVIAQGLAAAAATVSEDYRVHSLHAYFILGGRLDEPVRYEVDRVRNGRSFTTRRVVARQSYGAILTLEASFHAHEDGPDVQTVPMPDVRGPEELPEVGWGWVLERRQGMPDAGSARAYAWLRVDPTVGDSAVAHACALALASDTSTVTAVRATHPATRWTTRKEISEQFMAASLDHAVWFHRPARADGWLLIDVNCDNLIGVRGLTIGHVFDQAGTHVATITQEALVRERSGPTPSARDLSGT